MKNFTLPFLSTHLIEQPSDGVLILRHKDRKYAEHRMKEIGRAREAFRNGEHLRGGPVPQQTRQVQIGQQQQMSSSLAQTILGTKAAAWVLQNAVTPTYIRSRGFATGTAIVRTGAGDYTLTLSDAIDTAATGDVLLTGGVQHTALATIAFELASTTTIRTRTALLTAAPAVTATDLSYWCKVEEIGPN